MSTTRRLIMAASLTILSRPAWALDPGVASGVFSREGVKFKFQPRHRAQSGQH